MESIFNKKNLEIEMYVGKYEKALLEELKVKNAEIKSAIETLNENLTPEGFLNFRYTPVIEELLEYDYEKAIQNKIKNIYEKPHLTLREGVEIAFSMEDVLGCKDGIKDSLCSVKSLFSDKGVDLPDSNEGLYNLVINKDGRREALTKLRYADSMAAEMKSKVISAITNQDSSAVKYLASVFEKLARIETATK